MKKLLALLLAVLMCFGSCAQAVEDENWTDYQPIIMGLMYENTAAVLESDPSRVVSTACAVLDYAMAEPTAYEIGNGEHYYVMGDSDVVLYGCPAVANDDGVQSLLIVYDFVDKVYSVCTTTMPVDDMVKSLSETTGIPYQMTNKQVAEAAQLLVDIITEE